MFLKNGTEIFADGAKLNEIAIANENKYVKGFTTNPTLMAKAGIVDYEGFCKSVLEIIGNKPLSLEVFSDEEDEMIQQANKLNSLGKNVFVKVPCRFTNGKSTKHLVKKLIESELKINVTAVFTENQVDEFLDVLNPKIPSFISIFGGRIADTGIDPRPLIKKSVEKTEGNQKIIWASPREVLNIFQADEVGCHAITITQDLLSKLYLLNKNLEEYSIETVQMFYNDALQSGFKL
jgi:transaldolase